MLVCCTGNVLSGDGFMNHLKHLATSLHFRRCMLNTSIIPPLSPTYSFVIFLINASMRGLFTETACSLFFPSLNDTKSGTFPAPYLANNFAFSLSVVLSFTNSISGYMPSNSSKSVDAVVQGCESGLGLMNRIKTCVCFARNSQRSRTYSCILTVWYCKISK